mgnify:CR=1 FL=1
MAIKLLELAKKIFGPKKVSQQMGTKTGVKLLSGGKNDPFKGIYNVEMLKNNPKALEEAKKQLENNLGYAFSNKNTLELQRFEKNLEAVDAAMNPKSADVIPFKKQEGIVRRPEEFATRKEYERYLDETLGPSDDVFGSPMKDDLLKKWDKVNAKNVTPKEGIMATDEAADMVKGEVNPITDQMSTQQRKFLGFPNRTVEAIVRTAARDVLEKAGLGPRIKGQDPIDMARQIYGDEILEALDNISGELLDASSYPEISRILTEKKIYNFKPRQGLDIKQKGEIEDITAFDPEGRDPNADGGLIDILKL